MMEPEEDKQCWKVTYYEPDELPYIVIVDSFDKAWAAAMPTDIRGWAIYHNSDKCLSFITEDGEYATVIEQLF